MTTAVSTSSRRTAPRVWQAILDTLRLPCVGDQCPHSQCDGTQTEHSIEPTEAQWKILLTVAKYIAISGGEQGGKSFIVVILLVLRFILLPRSQAPFLIWLVGRRYEDSEKEWEYLIKFCLQLGWLDPRRYSRAGPEKKRLATLKDGTEIKTLTIAEEMNIGKERPDFILGCEISQASEEAYRKLRARAAASGGDMFLSGTYEAQWDWFTDLIEVWQNHTSQHASFALASWSNPHVYPEGREDPKILELIADASDEFVLERLSGIPRKPKGLVFGDVFDPKYHIREIDYIPGLPVYLAIDPGYNQSVHAAIALQLPVGGPIHWFDEIYDNLLTTSEMIEQLQLRPWWSDVDPNESVIDIQATARQQAQDDPPIVIWEEKSGLSLNTVKVPIQDGIDRFRSFLRVDPVTGNPGMVIAPRCRGSLAELGSGKNPLTGTKGAYMWQFDARGEKKGIVPRNRYNDAIKAVTYWLVYKFGFVKSKRGNKVRGKLWSQQHQQLYG